VGLITSRFHHLDDGAVGARKRSVGAPGLERIFAAMLAYHVHKGFAMATSRPNDGCAGRGRPAWRPRGRRGPFHQRNVEISVSEMARNVVAVLRRVGVLEPNTVS